MWLSLSGIKIVIHREIMSELESEIEREREGRERECE